LAPGGRQFVGIKARQNAQSSHVIGIHIDPNDAVQQRGRRQDFLTRKAMMPARLLQRLVSRSPVLSKSSLRFEETTGWASRELLFL
jgi:hypothetical protein